MVLPFMKESITAQWIENWVWESLHGNPLRTYLMQIHGPLSKSELVGGSRMDLVFLSVFRWPDAQLVLKSTPVDTPQCSFQSKHSVMKVSEDSAVANFRYQHQQKSLFWASRSFTATRVFNIYISIWEWFLMLKMAEQSWLKGRQNKHKL